MSSPAPFAPIAELLERSLSIRHVYGDAVHQNEKTVIPVATVAYGFGAGGGSAPGHDDAQGAGGGGGVRMTPAGALEIGPDGTRFISFHPWARWLTVGAVGLTAGWLLGRRR